MWTLLFLVPGIPSIYYGSEFGINGKRNSHGDFELRPTLPPFANIPDFAKPAVDSNALENVIKQFAFLRNQEIALQKGGYKGLFVSNEAFAFQRDFYKEKIIIAVNATEEGKVISLEDTFHGNFTNLLTGEKFSGSLKDVFVPGNWLTVIKNTSV